MDALVRQEYAKAYTEELYIPKQEDRMYSPEDNPNLYKYIDRNGNEKEMSISCHLLTVRHYQALHGTFTHKLLPMLGTQELYCELPNQDRSPTCKSYASRKAYDIKIVEDTAELAYKREYQRRMTKVYRASEVVKPVMRIKFNSWKDKVRKQLNLYRENKITADEVCNWLDKNK